MAAPAAFRHNETRTMLPYPHEGDTTLWAHCVVSMAPVCQSSWELTSPAGHGGEHRPVVGGWIIHFHRVEKGLSIIATNAVEKREEGC